MIFANWNLLRSSDDQVSADACACMSVCVCVIFCAPYTNLHSPEPPLHTSTSGWKISILRDATAKLFISGSWVEDEDNLQKHHTTPNNIDNTL